jgi:porphobilinogen deaminase
MSVIILTRAQLDAAPQPIVISGRCHQHSEQLVFYMGGAIAIRCRTCNKHVANVAMDVATQAVIDTQKIERGDEAVRLKGSCHPKAGMFIVYNEGTITAACGKCKHEVTKLGVKPATGET